MTTRCGRCPQCTAAWSPQRNGLQGSTQAVTLEWGQPLPDSCAPPYNILLSSDLVYSTASVQPLLRTITALSGPDSLVLYACEFREGAGLENFHQLLPRFGLDPQLVSLSWDWRWLLTGLVLGGLRKLSSRCGSHLCHAAGPD